MDARPDHFPLILKSMLAAALLIVIGAAAFQLMHLLMVVFGAVVVAVLIRAVADLIEDYTPLSGRWTFYAALLVILLLIAGFVWLFGNQVRQQYSAVVETVPEVVEQLQAWVESMPGGPTLIASFEGFTLSEERVLPGIQQVLGSIASFLTDFVVLIFGALFIAGNPGLYRRGLVLLVPKKHRPLADEALRDAGRAVKLWMGGQLVSMVIIGFLTGLGLWLVGVPAPIALGLIMGVAEAIPWIGPWLGGIPIVIMALAAGPDTVLWAILVVFLVQQAEGILVTPLVQKQAVMLPPAVTVFGIIAFGMLFGVIGLLFAAPLLVVVFVLIKRLYVEEALDTPTEIPGRDD